MSHRIDSAQIAAIAGTAGGMALDNLSSIAAITCAIVGTAYTLWKWHREARRK